MDSRPALYSPTGYGIHDGEAVVRTPHTVKTLQGAGVEPLIALLEEIDGDTAASELRERVADATPDHIDALYAHDLVYDARAISADMRAADCGHMLESLLPAIPPESHHEVPARLQSLSVAVFGNRDTVSSVLSRLQAAGVTVTNGTTAEPDAVLLSEQLERSESWDRANEQWIDTDATLVKSRLTATGWRFGPVLTPTAPACVNCVYSRVDANKAGGRLYTETVTGEPPHWRAYVDSLTELLFRVLLKQVPRYLDEQFVVYDHYEQTVETPRVFALPHCEVCDGI